ncbi:MAG: glycosyltransferase family 4 protein [Bacteroidales bacterium]|nr:glycosyltransferase family 4 protein [Bacteroidales bacterium]HRX32373.1 glycosyltransferase family 4 protein [Tenuifilaceae bacterium]
MRQKSFCIFTTETLPTLAGDGRNAFLWARIFVEKGFDVQLISLNPNGKLLPVEVIDSVKIKRILYYTRNKFAKLIYRLRLLNHLFFVNKKVWVVYGAMPGHLLILFIGRILRKKVVFRSTLWGFDNASELVTNFKRVKRYVYRKSSVYWALNSAFVTDWKLNVNSKMPIYLSSQGVDIERFSINEEKSALRKKLGLPEDTVIVLMVGHLIERKGFPWVFEWLSEVNGSFVLVHLGNFEAADWDMVSAQNAAMLLNRQKGEAVLSNRLILMGGNISAVEEVYKASDIFLLASENEGYPPNSVNEAMAAGLPIVSKNIVGASDYIQNNDNGFLFETKKEFIGCLSRLVNDEKLRLKMGQMSLSKTILYNSIQSVTDEFIRYLTIKGALSE